MSSKQERFSIAVLDDYQRAALSLADWSVLEARATVTVFNDHLADSDGVVERLQPFDIVCVMRERTPMTRTIIEQLPKLRMIASTGTRNASIDLKAAEERGVQVVHTGYTSAPTIELTWALILGSARNLVAENTSLRGGGWQQSVGDDMAGRTLGVLGLGNVGGAVAQIGNAFCMKVIAWSQNLTTGRAAEVGATLVSRDELFQEADVVTIYLVLSKRTRGLVGAAELTLMKSTARLVNTSRGPLRPGTVAAGPFAPRAAEPIGNDAYRLRLPRALRSLLPRYGREHLPLVRRADSRSRRSLNKGEEKCCRVAPVFSAFRKPLCPVLGFSGSLRARCSHSSAGACRLPPPRILNCCRVVERPGPKILRAAWGPSS
jgi:phosphoglycerate dehydrogenase-like enzyme